VNAAETDARWWSAPELRGELDAVLNLVNAARREALLDEEKAARKFCDALNRAWNARARLSAEPSPESDWPLVKALVSAGRINNTTTSIFLSFKPRQNYRTVADGAPHVKTV